MTHCVTYNRDSVIGQRTQCNAARVTNLVTYNKDSVIGQSPF